MKQFKRYIQIYVIALIAIIPIVSSCSYDDEPRIQPTQKTLFVYMPWATNLLSAFETNLSDMQSYIESNNIDGNRIVVFLADYPNHGKMFELVKDGSRVYRKFLKDYKNPAFTSAAWITGLLNDVKHVSPSQNYAMVIGCHGMGWLPAGSFGRGTRSAGKKIPEGGINTDGIYAGYHLTRYFGGEELESQTNVSDLVKGIRDAGLRMEFVMFDDCYMASVEVAEQMQAVTDHIVGATCEIMAYGMPYHLLLGDLLGQTNYRNICKHFYDFYSTYESPYGAMGVINTREINGLAEIMKQINARYTFHGSETDIQKMDGYYPTIFFDCGSYIDSLCKDPVLLNAAKEQLDRVVPNKTHTQYYYSAVAGRKYYINSFSGITISDPSTNSKVVKTKLETPWYKMTH